MIENTEEIVQYVISNWDMIAAYAIAGSSLLVKGLSKFAKIYPGNKYEEELDGWRKALQKTSDWADTLGINPKEDEAKPRTKKVREK